LARGLEGLIEASGMTQSEYIRWLIERQVEGQYVPPGFVKLNLTLRECVMEEMEFLASSYGQSTAAEVFVTAALEGLTLLMQKVDDRNALRDRLAEKQHSRSKEQAVSQRYVNP